MKFSHNKKRNTAFIFEALIKEMTKATLDKDSQRKQQCLSILREGFSKNSALKKELDIYNSFSDVEDLSPEALDKIVQESKKQFASLDRKAIYSQQSRIINSINKLLGESVWNNFVMNYKKLATLNQVLSQTLAPKKQVMLETKLLQDLQNKKEKKMFPKVNNLAVSTFINKFNEKYSDHLSEDQKIFLSRYIQANDDNSLEFKTYLYEEIDRIKACLAEQQARLDKETGDKVQLVVERIGNFDKRKFDNEFIFEVLRIQTLVEQLQNNG